MAKIEAIDVASLTFPEAAAPATPALTKWKVYTKTTGLFVMDDAGVETGPLASATSAAPFVGCTAVRTTDQTGVVTATDTAVSFNGTDEIDTDAFHDPGTNPSRITIPTGKAGKYIFTANIIWDTNATGLRQAQIRKNGTTAMMVDTRNAVTGTFYTYNVLVTSPLAMSVTDYMEVIVFQSSGANRTISGSVVTARFSAQFIGA